jgi:hypothetical protein
MKFEFNFIETTLGRVNTGSPIIYKEKLYLVLNPCEKGTKLIRSLIGETHEALVLDSDTKVCYISHEKLVDEK